MKDFIFSYDIVRGKAIELIPTLSLTKVGDYIYLQFSFIKLITFIRVTL